MIDKVISAINRLNIPGDVKVALTNDIRAIQECGTDVASQNLALYQACGVIKAKLAPTGLAEELCRYLCDTLTVPVPDKVVRGSIRKNKNQPVKVYPDTDEVIEVIP